MVLFLFTACMRVPTGEDSSISSTSEDSTGGSEATTMVVEGRCGDGVQDEGEGCDDGNEVDEDVCPSGAVGRARGRGAALAAVLV